MRDTCSILNRILVQQLTVVVLRTMLRAATLNGAVRIADVASIMSRSCARPRQMMDWSSSRGERQEMLGCGAERASTSTSAEELKLKLEARCTFHPTQLSAR